MKLYIALLVLALLLVPSVALAQQGTVPTPPPVTTPPPIDPVDQANAEAAQWDAVQQAAMGQAQAAANQAAAAAAQANAAARQAEYAAQQERTARQAAQQGQINQAVQSANAAQLASVQAIALGRDATQSASIASQQADLALRNVANLKTALAQTSAERDAARQDATRWSTEALRLDRDRTAFAGALKAEQDRSDLLGKVAIGSLLLLTITLVYMALVLARLMHALRIQPRDRMVVLDERGRVKAQIEAIH